MADTKGIRAGRAFVELGVSDKLSAGLRRAQKQLEAFGAGLRAVGIRMAGIGVAAVTSLLGAARMFATVGDDLEEMSQRTGVSVEALSELGFAADIAGSDLETLETGIKHMQRAIVEAADGSEAAQQALAKLGLSAADLAGLSPDEQFKRMADGIARIEDPALRVALIVLGVAVSGIGAAMGLLAGVISGVGTFFGLIGAAIGALLSPIGLVVAAVVGLGGTLLVASGAGGEALSWLMAQFTRLRDWVGKVVGGISDALAAGDIALAAQVLWLSLKVIWQQGVAALNKAWLGAKEFFVSTAYSIWYGALAAAEIVFHALEVGWIETVAFLSKTWTNFASGFQMIWEEASSWVAKRMLEIQGLFDSGLDVDAAKKAVDQQLESRLVELENAAQQTVAVREKERESQRKDAAAMHEATLAGIGQDFEDAQKTLKDKTEAGLAESQAALDAAKKKLADAIELARQKREAADAEKGPGRSPRDLMTEFEDRLSGLGDAIAKGISVRGTFNAAGSAGLGGGDAAERTARATEQTAKNTKRLVDALGTGGLAFT